MYVLARSVSVCVHGAGVAVGAWGAGVELHAAAAGFPFFSSAFDCLEVCLQIAAMTRACGHENAGDREKGVLRG